jgi:hemerythrin-like domain-containing protein
MVIYEELKKDHREVLALCDRLIQSADANAQQRNSLITQIRDALIPHSRAEEAVFYNAIRQESDEKGVVGHAYTEHVMAETLLRSLQVQGVVDIAWRQTATKLRDALAHHIQEEETEMFATAQKIFSTQEAEQIGAAFVQLKPQIEEQGFMGTSLDLVANLLPARFTATFKKLGVPSSRA